ncbi:MAG: hypothetical protein JRI55_37330, partial [Deltaproteobacteria bacterium]|nr:hypothetical protein [Deltaproteobacteria bacterium]
MSGSCLVALVGIALLPGCKEDDCATLPPQIEVTLTSMSWAQIDGVRIEAQLGDEPARVLSRAPDDLQRVDDAARAFFIRFSGGVEAGEELTISAAGLRDKEVVASAPSITLALQPDGCNRVTLALEASGDDAGTDLDGPDDGPDDSIDSSDTSDGPVGPPVEVFDLLAGVGASRVQLTFDGANYLAVWTEMAGDTYVVRGQLWSVTGQTLGAAPIEIFTPPDTTLQAFVTGAASGTGTFFVTWSMREFKTTTNGVQVTSLGARGQLVKEDGTLVGDLIDFGNKSSVVVAYGGGTY